MSVRRVAGRSAALAAILIATSTAALTSRPATGQTTTAPPASSSTATTATVATTATNAPSSTTGPAASTSTTATSATSTTAPSTRWKVLFGGDSLLTEPISAQTDPFARIRPPLASADLAIVNVETAISTRGTAAIKTYTFRSPPSFATRLAKAGVDVGSLANNHALDFGTGALADTVAYLRGVGVTPIGAGADLDDALHPAVLQIAGQSVAVLAGSQIIPTGAWVARESRPGIASGGGHTINAESRQLIDAVRKAKAANDVVLVVMHWGIEQDPCPEGVQRTLGRLLREAGATVVLGAHPHVLQPIVSDAVKRADGTVEQGLVAYSLGNFIWGPRSGASADTGVLELDFDGAQLVGHQLHPHRLDGNGWAAAVDPASADGRRIIARTTRRC